MKQMYRVPRVQRLLVLLLCSLVLLSAVCPFFASAAPNASRVVKVGYVWSTNFAEGEQDGQYKSGYAYEYLQKIAYYTGWSYEYVYGDWSTILQMLTDGTVDVMAGVSLTPERTEIMDFPNYPMGLENYYIYVWQNSQLANQPVSALTGLKIGCTEGSMQNYYLESWNNDNGSNCVVQTYSGNIDMYRDFSSHAIDAVVDTDNAILPTDGLVPLEKVGASDYYLAVRKNAGNLLAELNDALEEIDHSDPYYLQKLHSKYFSATSIASTLSPAEKAWLSEHPVIRVGYMNAYLPYCGTDNDGLATGIVVDVFSSLFDKLVIDPQPEIQYIGFDDQLDLVEAVHAGIVDVAFPIFGDIWFSEEMDLYQSADIAQIVPDLIFKGEYSDLSIEKIGVNRNNLIQYQDSARRFPAAEIVFYDSIEDCLKAVVSGEIDCTILNNLRTDALIQRDIYHSLNALELTSTIALSMGVQRGDTALLSLLNHALYTLDEHFALSNAYKYQDNIYVYTAKDFILENFSWVITGIVFIAALIVLFLLRDAYQTRRYLAQQKELTKNLEDALAEARYANQAKTLFLNNISHDIRTPMNAIIGFTDIALKQTQDENVRKSLEKISSSSNHLLTLINDVLDLSRVESGKTVYTEVPCSLCAVTDAVLDIAQGYLTGRDLHFQVNRPTEGHCMVLTDPVRLRGILVNILSNAIKFTDNGGSITFSMGTRPGTDDRHMLVWFTVSDTGVGMTEEFQSHIFEEFSQEENGARTNYKGTGLGMAITKRYVDLMGGTISVTSQKGKGSTFTVELPMSISDADAVHTPAQSDAPCDLTGVRALMAEDNDLNAEIATVLLEEAGMQITRVENGQQAVSCFADCPENTFDVILMDIMMPHMNGYEATRAIRSMEGRPDGKTIPIIAMTANAFAEDVQASLDAGMNAHLAKPLVMDEVLKTLSEAVRK